MNRIIVNEVEKAPSRLHSNGHEKHQRLQKRVGHDVARKQSEHEEQERRLEKVPNPIQPLLSHLEKQEEHIKTLYRYIETLDAQSFAKDEKLGRVSRQRATKIIRRMKNVDLSSAFISWRAVTREAAVLKREKFEKL